MTVLAASLFAAMVASLAFRLGKTRGKGLLEGSLREAERGGAALEEACAAYQQQVGVLGRENARLRASAVALEAHVNELTEQNAKLSRNIEESVADALREMIGEEGSPAHHILQGLTDAQVAFGLVVDRSNDLFDMAERNIERFRDYLVRLGIVQPGVGDEDGLGPSVELPGNAEDYFGGRTTEEAIRMLRDVRVTLASSRVAKFGVEWLTSLLDALIGLGARYLDEMTEEPE